MELSLIYVVETVMDRLFAEGSLSNFNWKKRSKQKEVFSKLPILSKIIGNIGFMCCLL